MLTALENENAHLSGGSSLFLNALVQVGLRLVEFERLIAGARVFWPDLETPTGVVLEVILETLANGALALTQAAQVHPRAS